VTALVACIGNVLLGDDGFGVEVGRRLGTLDGARVMDVGVRALHLAYEMLEPWDSVLIVDAVDRSAPPGTLFVLEPSDCAADASPLPDGHGLHPAAVLRLARDLGARVDHVTIVGCQPQNLEEGIGLSEPVQRAVGEAVHVIRKLLKGEPSFAA
jgi:hydrogenase maturation protease